MSRHALQVDLSGGPVIFLEATPEELLQAARLAAEPSLASAELALATAGLGLTVRSVFGVTVGPIDLAGEPLETRMSLRAYKGLVAAWLREQLGSTEEREQVADSLKETALGWRVRIGEREFLVAELPMKGVLAVNRAADREKTPAGRILAVGTEGIRASLRAIDGQPITAAELQGANLGDKISGKEAWLLSLMWPRMQGDEEVGEAKAVAGL